MVSFVDTSALLKLYVVEAGSRWMTEQVRPGGIAISELAVVEVGASLNRRVRDGTLTDAAGRDAWRSFRRELRSFIVSRLDRPSLVAAAHLTARSPILLRILDSIHLQGASAVAADARRLRQPPPRFVSADDRLLAAATAVGLVTENPLHYS